MNKATTKLSLVFILLYCFHIYQLSPKGNFDFHTSSINLEHFYILVVQKVLSYSAMFNFYNINYEADWNFPDDKDKEAET